ncbi:MAG TPA: hypothetical protein VGQ57_15680 [Polyangiaceae bacterium]|nr:hypothetical protein [Polyangiaceae bacterium]
MSRSLSRSAASALIAILVLPACSGVRTERPNPYAGDSSAFNGDGNGSGETPDHTASGDASTGSKTGSSDTQGGSTKVGSGSTSGATAKTALAVADDPSRISALTDCALAQDGRCVVPITRTHDEVCQRFASDWPKQAPADYTLATDPCAPATLGKGAQSDAVRRLNFYRWLAGLSPVTANDEWSAAAAACSAIQAHLDDVNHAPPPTASCYSALGGVASAQSALDLGGHTPADAIDDLVWDGGARNFHALGHRWALLHPGLGPVGFGFSHPSGGRRATCVRETSGGGLSRAQDLTGVVSYPSFGSTPYELISREATASPVDSPLEWSVTLGDSVAIASASARVYRLGKKGYEPVQAASGPLSSFHGVWIDLASDPEPGTYIVLVSGTGLGEFGYRATIERCGADTPPTCDVIAQDCRVEGYGCYGPSAPFCAKSQRLPNGAACQGNLPSECEPGSVCAENSGGREGYACAAYCEPDDRGSSKSCDKICSGNYVAVEAQESGAVVGGYCEPGTGGGCDPLAPHCGPGQGCYDWKPARCLAVGTRGPRQSCQYANDCAPGLTCIGVESLTCEPYCDPKSKSGPASCRAMCQADFWDYGSFGICKR